ncbi:hypothetical protein PLESTB_001391100 [Pleodorina starrii]|uniref:Peptidase S54 rhomboid domain-containing protein n=1 Tax=Pleodorina starrii TaxID=330485 RepID=A0A9W6BV95_9CHLO|nr:hypothetical protein PLESTM_000541400 [Pleodorina starrii]GLC58698.1 hypothetical protein PLESTB_001391100 [Pleodorina starrii]GLC75217.1 hypothetical protein PLESTF_001608000 [Pleodorina starrii]
MHRGRRPQLRNPHAALLLAQLAARILQLEYKPPVTIALVAVNALLFFVDLREFLPPKALLRLLDGALQPRLILERGEWWRLLSSAFLHLDEWHLYYNMSSLLWKGVQLERRYGTKLFAALVSELLLLSQGLYIVLTVLLSSQIPGYRYLYRDLRVAGFSDVLFALKVVLTRHSPDYSDVMGIRVPTKYACWAELFLASYLTPHVSFLGHLAGILAGLLHVRVIEPAARSARGEARRWYVRCVNSLRRRQMPREGGRRLGGGGGAAVVGARTAADQQPAARAGHVLGGSGGRGGGGTGGAGGSDSRNDGYGYSGGDGGGGGGGGGGGFGGWDAAGLRSRDGMEQRRRHVRAADDSDDGDSDGDGGGGGGGGGRTAGGMTPEEMRQRRLERLERAPGAASGRYGTGTGRRNGGEPQQSAAADPFQPPTTNRRYFNCGGTLGGGDASGGGGGGVGGAVQAVSAAGAGTAAPRPGPTHTVAAVSGSGADDQLREGMGGGGAAAAGSWAAGTEALTDEELRRRRLERLDRPRRG